MLPSLACPKVRPIWRNVRRIVNTREDYFLSPRLEIKERDIRKRLRGATGQPSREHQYCLSSLSRKSILRVFPDYWHAP